MRNSLHILTVSFAIVLTGRMAAQTTVTADGTGSINNIPVYSGPNSLTSSSLFVVSGQNGEVGINVSSPAYTLDISAYTSPIIRLFDTYGGPQSASNSAILFAGPSAPNGFSMLYGAGGDYAGGDGVMQIYTSRAGTLIPNWFFSPYGNLGIGEVFNRLTYPNNELSIIASNPRSDTAAHIQNTEANGYSDITLDTETGAQGGGLYQLNSQIGTSPTAYNAPTATVLVSNQPGGLSLATQNPASSIMFFGGSGIAERMRITPSGNVGIGTSSPGFPLEVNGTIAITPGAPGGIRFSDGSLQTTASSSAASGPITSLGTVTSGTWEATPIAASYLPSDVAYTDVAQVMSGQTSFTSASGVGIGTTAPVAQLTVTNSGTGANGEKMVIQRAGPGDVGLSFQQTNVDSFGLVQRAGAGSGLAFVSNYYEGNAGTEVVRISDNGNVGIGTSSPSSALEVNGNIRLTASSGASITFPDTTVQSTAWNGVLSGGDYAESVNISGGREEYEPGDVLVIDPASEGRFLKSSTPYSTTVTGIYSTRPGVVGRRQRTAREHMNEEVPMAMTGIVPTKVSAENGPIKAGDLLVTSSKSGYAMKGTDRTQMLGAIIGKAIGHLDSGVGVIEAVVTLQ